MRDILLQIGQVLTVILLAPLLQGVILQWEERVQRAQGPGIFQPYRDLWKLFHKQAVVPQTASFIYWIAPIVAFTCMLTLGSFLITLAGLDSGSSYGGIGSSRAVMLGILAEPTLILVFVGITLLAKSMLPFVVNHLLVQQPALYWST